MSRGEKLEMNREILMPGTPASPGSAAANYQEEQMLAQEIVEIWRRGRKDRELLGRKLVQFRNIFKRRPGRAGNFLEWLRDAGIPKSTAYDLMAQHEGTLELKQVPNNQQPGISESGSSDTLQDRNSDGETESIAQPEFHHPEDLDDLPAPLQTTDAPETADDVNDEDTISAIYHHTVKVLEGYKPAGTVRMQTIDRVMRAVYFRVNARFYVSTTNPVDYLRTEDFERFQERLVQEVINA
jgi:hypothetical protein